jgi:pimeloyl-ACP methyl ester carboxylesterase
MIPASAMTLTLLFGLVGAGCTSPANPSFVVSPAEAKAALKQMQAAPKSLPRPVVVLGGYHDPGLGAFVWRSEVRKWAKDATIIEVSFTFDHDFDQCRRDVIAAVDRACPTEDKDATVEVDVIGASMGGLVGRYAAVTRPGERRLNVVRLFTVSSPHRGAAWADAVPALSRLHADMRENSDFFKRLEAAEAVTTADDYELVPYVRLGDRIVGADHAAPAGRSAWWVPNRPMELAHFGASTDPRVRADVARRLRGEVPFTKTPPAPVPGA